MKRLLTTTVMLSFTTIALAQPNINIKAGIANSDFRGNAIDLLNKATDFAGDYVTRKSLTGYYVGVGTTVPIGESFFVEPALLYTRTGTTMRAALDIAVLEMMGIGANLDLVQQNIELPLMVGAELAPGLKIKAGPQASYTLASDLRIRAAALGINLLNQKIGVANGFEPFNVGVAGGISHTLNNGLGFEAGYQQGLTRVTSGRSTDTYTQSWRAGVSFAF